MNVILLDDEESPWSLKFVRGQILKALESESVQENGKKTLETYTFALLTPPFSFLIYNPPHHQK